MKFHKEFERALSVHQQGKLREAFLRYGAILKADPRHAAALHYSGLVLHQSGQHPAAADRIRASLDIDPSSADAWSNLALVLGAAQRPGPALQALREAFRRAPDTPEIAVNLSGLLLSQGQAVEAEAIARRATQVDATHAGGWFNLALALERQERVLEALDAASRAAALRPTEPSFSGFKAQLEGSLDARDRARATLESALARSPTSAALRFEYATLLERSGDPVAAATAYSQALALEPGNGAILSQLIFVKRWLADWNDLAALEERFREGVERGQTHLSPFVLLGMPSTRALQRRCADIWDATIAAPKAALAPARHRPFARARLRIGYLSSDFHTHATAFLAAGLFELHDRSRFEVFAYSAGRDDGSPMRRRLVEAFEHFIDVHTLLPEAIAQRIQADEIDILVDLKGHTGGAQPRVLALHPAPIQVHYLGYPGTLGDRLADYLVADSEVLPEAHAADYAEMPVRVPGSYQVNDRQRPISEPGTRASVGLPNDAVVYCNFNATWKIRPETLDAWAAIMKRVPGSVLWLLARRDKDPAIANLVREAGRRGIAAHRIAFAAARPNADYLALYAHADLFLDTWPYGAHTTASDALWAGCPVLGLRGDTFAGRVGASLLHAAGMPDLVVDSVEQYVARAVSLGLAPAERAKLRERLAAERDQCALFDTQATTRALEFAYQVMVDQYRTGTRLPIDLVRDESANPA